LARECFHGSAQAGGGGANHADRGGCHNLSNDKGLTFAHAMDHSDPGKRMEAFVEEASSHNSFNVLFVLSFFASLAVVMIRYA
jgi:hypothetical protein